MRYMGQGTEDEKVGKLIEELIPLSIRKAKPKASFVMKKLERRGEELIFGNVTTNSSSLKKAFFSIKKLISGS